MCECFNKAERYVCAIPCFDVKDVKSRGSSSGTIREHTTTMQMCVCTCAWISDAYPSVYIHPN